jgi:hypothetical protein
MKNLVFLIAVVLPMIAVPAIAPAKTVSDRQTGLVVHYPSDWRRDFASTAFLIYSFPRKEEVLQLIEPIGGASIVVSAYPEDVKSIYKAMKVEHVSELNGDVWKQIMIQTTAGPVEAVEVLSQRGYDPDGFGPFHLFCVHGRIYKTGLSYRGEAYKDKFEKIYYQIIETLEFPEGDAAPAKHAARKKK